MNQIELIQLAKTIEHSHLLEQYSVKQAKAFSRMLAAVRKELFARFDKMTPYHKGRAITLFALTEEALAAVRIRLTGHLTDMAAHVSASSSVTHSAILGWEGTAANVQAVKLAPHIMRKFWTKTPVGGRLLKEWVDSAFDYEMKDRLKQEIGKGLWLGESYANIKKRLATGIDCTSRHLETIIRTTVATANTDAMSRVYKENADVIKKLRWTAALEAGRGSGRGVCLICASLDGRTYDVGHAPACPQHPRCRCILSAVVDMKALGLSQYDFDKIARPYRVHKEGVSKGGKVIIEHGKFTGSYGDWIMGQPDTVLKQTVGPNRFDLLKTGRIQFSDLVDLRTKRPRTLAQLANV